MNRKTEIGNGKKEKGKKGKERKGKNDQ